MSALCVRVKPGELKLERVVNSTPVVFLPGFVYKLPITHPRDIHGLDGNTTVDSAGMNPAGLIWWFDRKAKPDDLSRISREATMASRMRRSQIMARVRAKLDAQLGPGWSEVEIGRVSVIAGQDADEHLLTVYNSIVSDSDRIDSLPARQLDPHKDTEKAAQETDADGELLNLPESVCSQCGHQFSTRRSMENHRRAVHDARRSKAKKRFHEGMLGESVAFIEEPV